MDNNKSEVNYLFILYLLDNGLETKLKYYNKYNMHGEKARKKKKNDNN